MSKVAIVGAGPAGCAAGYHLASSGHQVVLIDKEKFPRDKVCGDGVSLGAIQALSSMGICPKDIKKQASEFETLNSLILGTSNGRFAITKSPFEYYCIPRLVFDHLLYEKAIKAGCSPMTESIFDIHSAHQDLYKEFDHIIDARGVYSGEINAIAVRAYWTVKSEDYVEYYHSGIHIYFDKALGSHGYGWIFPVSTNNGLVKLNVGVIIFADERLQKMNKSIVKHFEQFAQENNIMKTLSKKAVSKQNIKAYPLATAKKNHQVNQGKILKIGDAANLTDPFTGEGIANAILSGTYVAQAINMSTTPESAAICWQYIYQAHFQEHFRAGSLIRKMKSSWTITKGLIWLMNQNSYFAEQVCHSVLGLTQYNELLSSLLFKI